MTGRCKRQMRLQIEGLAVAASGSVGGESNGDSSKDGKEILAKREKSR